MAKLAVFVAVLYLSLCGEFCDPLELGQFFGQAVCAAKINVSQLKNRKDLLHPRLSSISTTKDFNPGQNTDPWSKPKPEPDSEQEPEPMPEPEQDPECEGKDCIENTESGFLECDPPCYCEDDEDYAGSEPHCMWDAYDGSNWD